MTTINLVTTLPSSASPNVVEHSDSSIPTYSARKKRLPPNLGSPTPARRTSHQLHKGRKPAIKPRAASTSALAALKAPRPRRSLPGAFPLPTPLSTDQVEDTRRSERGASEPLQTPDRPTVKAPSPSRSAPAVTTRSSLKKPRSKLEAVTNETADQLLAKEIRNAPTVPSGDDAKTGTNYVLNMYHQNDPTERFVKVGETRDHGDARRKKIRWTCGHVGYNVSIPGQVPSRYWKKIEKLVHLELRPHRYAIDCGCGTSHREYFKTPVHLAVEATQRWSHFCESQPWDSRGKLSPFWEARLSDLQASQDLEKATPEDRARLWKDFAVPGSVPFWKYNAFLYLHSLSLKYQIWLLFAMNAALNTVTGPNWYLMYLNVAWQFLFLWLYTFDGVEIARNYARKSAKKTATPKHHVAPAHTSRESTHESDTDDGSSASDAGDDSPMPVLAIRKGGRPGSSRQDPIDLRSDSEYE